MARGMMVVVHERVPGAATTKPLSNVEPGAQRFLRISEPESRSQSAGVILSLVITTVFANSHC